MFRLLTLLLTVVASLAKHTPHEPHNPHEPERPGHSKGPHGTPPDIHEAQARARGELDKGKPGEGSGPKIEGPASKRPVTDPHDRHNLNRIRPKMPAKAKNTVILPGTDVRGDLAAINNGEAHWNKDKNCYEINGREYGVEPNGTVYPIKGPGFAELSRSEYKALQGLIAGNGDMSAVPGSFSKNPSISEADWARAREIYEQRTNK